MGEDVTGPDGPGPNEASPMLEVVDLVKHFGAIKAVDGVSFSLRPGELVGLLGPNGAGKSTTFRCMVGLQRPDRGTVRIGGTDIHQDRVEALRKIGYVGQDARTYQYLTGEEVLRVNGQIRELEPELLNERIAFLLELFNLEDSSHRLVHHYSGGMARKLAIAAAVIHRPSIVLLDESFAGLDPESTEAIRRHLDVLREHGTTVLLSSHVLDMLERWVSRIIILAEGRIVEDLSRSALDQKLGDDFSSLTDLYLERTQNSDRGSQA